MKRFPQVWRALTGMLRAVSAAGPIGWMGAVSIAALALAGFAIYAIVEIVIKLKG